MILVDTNILVALIRGDNPIKLADLLRQNNGAVCGIVRAELLNGARSIVESQQVLTILNALGHIPLPETIWDLVGDNLRILRSLGITVPFPDAAIATLAISNNVELWTRDAHFVLMQRALPSLRLFVEPT